MNKPIKRINRDLIATNSRFNVFFDHILDKKTGEEVKDYLVVDPLVNEDGYTGVSILPVAKNKIGLIKLFRHATESYSWETPRGFPEKGENFKDAASRELFEETGISCPSDMLEYLGSISTETGVIRGKNKVFLAQSTSIISNHIPEELGYDDFGFFDSEKLKILIGEGLIYDAATLAILALYNFYLESQKD